MMGADGYAFQQSDGDLPGVDMYGDYRYVHSAWRRVRFVTTVYYGDPLPVENARVPFDRFSAAPSCDLQLLSRSNRSGPKEGTTSASTHRVTLPRVNENARSPGTSIGEPFAAQSEKVAGETGVKVGICQAGFDFNHAAEQTEQFLAVSKVMSLTRT